MGASRTSLICEWLVLLRYCVVRVVGVDVVLVLAVLLTDGVRGLLCTPFSPGKEHNMATFFCTGKVADGRRGARAYSRLVYAYLYPRSTFCISSVSRVRSPAPVRPSAAVVAEQGVGTAGDGVEVEQVAEVGLKEPAATVGGKRYWLWSRCGSRSGGGGKLCIRWRYIGQQRTYSFALTNFERGRGGAREREKSRARHPRDSVRLKKVCHTIEPAAVVSGSACMPCERLG